MMNEYIQSVYETMIKSFRPFYFYHLVPINYFKDVNGIISPKYMYEHKLYSLFDKSVEKYRNRIVNGWNYYKKKPEELTREEIIDSLERFRGKNGLNQIYLFKYPPYVHLGKNMENVLKGKFIFRINIDDPRLNLEEIDWGFAGSYSGNMKLTRQYYERVSVGNYFKDYDDNAQMIFANLNHISISPRDGIISFKYCKLTKIPITIQDISDLGPYVYT